MRPDLPTRWASGRKEKSRRLCAPSRCNRWRAQAVQSAARQQPRPPHHLQVVSRVAAASWTGTSGSSRLPRCKEPASRPQQPGPRRYHGPPPTTPDPSSPGGVVGIFPQSARPTAVPRLLLHPVAQDVFDCAHLPRRTEHDRMQAVHAHLPDRPNNRFSARATSAGHATAATPPARATGDRGAAPAGCAIRRRLGGPLPAGKGGTHERRPGARTRRQARRRTAPYIARAGCRSPQPPARRAQTPCAGTPTGRQKLSLPTGPRHVAKLAPISGSAASPRSPRPARTGAGPPW